MFDHVGVVFKDLKSSGAFYAKVLEQIGIKLLEDHAQPDGTGWLVFGDGRFGGALLRSRCRATLVLDCFQRTRM